MRSKAELSNDIEELRGIATAAQAALMAIMVVLSGRRQVEVKRNFDREAELARITLLNSVNSELQLAAFDKAVADFNAQFSAPR